MKNPIIKPAAAFAIIAGAQAAQASETDAKLNDLATNEIAQWAANPEIIAAIRTQNLATRACTDAQIGALDKSWRGEIGASAQSMIEPVTVGVNMEQLN